MRENTPAKRRREKRKIFCKTGGATLHRLAGSFNPRLTFAVGKQFNKLDDGSLDEKQVMTAQKLNERICSS